MHLYISSHLVMAALDEVLLFCFISEVAVAQIEQLSCPSSHVEVYIDYCAFRVEPVLTAGVQAAAGMGSGDRCGSSSAA